MNYRYVLKIKILDDSMKDFYKLHKHSYEGDAGIDLFTSESIILPANSTKNVIKTSIQAAMIKINNKSEVPYIIVSRSSIINTPLKMCNPINIIDAGYRGELKIYVDNMSDQPYTVEKGTRLAQIIAPTLQSIKVKTTKLLPASQRGSKGFGSSNNYLQPGKL